MNVLRACLIAVPCALANAAEPVPPAAPAVAVGVFADARSAIDLPPAWLTDSVVEQAVLATLAELPPAAANPRPLVLRSVAMDNFAREFDYARIPSCLRSDGLKFQPTRLGPFSIRGIRAAFPFMIVAKMRGKCD